MKALPAYPSLYQINTRVWLTELSRSLGRAATLDDIPDIELDRVAGMGFDWVWLLSVWRTGAAAQRISRLGLRGGDRSATLEGQPHVLGGDIILAAQGIELGTIDDLIRASKAIRDQPPGREVRMRVLRAGKIVELTTTWSGGAN
jgi:S1-C subfamily serine protease